MFPKFGSFAIYQDPLFILHSFYAFFLSILSSKLIKFCAFRQGSPQDACLKEKVWHRQKMKHFQNHKMKMFFAMEVPFVCRMTF